MKAGIVEYMLAQMDGKLRELKLSRDDILNISPEQFKYKKSSISQFLIEIEDDYREASQLVKSIHLQNKDLEEQTEYLEKKYHSLELKNLSTETALNEVRSNMKEMIKQLQYDEEREINDQNYIKQLEHNLSMAEEKLKKRNEEILELREGGMKYRTKEEKSFEEIYDDKKYSYLKYKPVIDDEGKDKDKYAKERKEITSTLNFNYENTSTKHKMNNNYEPTAIPIDELNTITSRKNNEGSINQISDLLSERENDKKLINDYLKDHLNLNAKEVVNNYNKNLKKNGEEKNADFNYENINSRGI